VRCESNLHYSIEKTFYCRDAFIWCSAAAPNMVQPCCTKCMVLRVTDTRFGISCCAACQVANKSAASPDPADPSRLKHGCPARISFALATPPSSKSGLHGQDCWCGVMAGEIHGRLAVVTPARGVGNKDNSSSAFSRASYYGSASERVAAAEAAAGEAACAPHRGGRSGSEGTVVAAAARRGGCTCKRRRGVAGTA
jgi:hypothetical protein